MAGVERFVRLAIDGANAAARQAGSPAPRSGRRARPAVAPANDPLLQSARDIAYDDQGMPVLDPVTGRPVLEGDGPQPTAPQFAEENFTLDEDGNLVPLEKPDARLALLESLGLAMRGMQPGAGPVVRNNALADLIAERRAMRAQEAASLPPLQNAVTSDSKGLSPSQEIPPKPASVVDFETGRRGANLGSDTLSEDAFEQLIPVAVDGPLERQYAPALDAFGNPKQAYKVDEYGDPVLDADGNPIPTGETIPAVTVDRWDPQLGAYVATAPDPLRPVSSVPVFEQTLTGDKYQKIDPTTGKGLTEPAYENIQGQVVRKGAPTYHVGRMVQGADGKSRIEVDTSRPVVVLERSRAGSDGNRSAESRVFLTPRKDGTYQVLTMGADGSPSYLRATDSDVQRLLAQGYEPTSGALSVQRPVMPESPEALARALIETRAGTVSDGRTYRVGVDSPETKADLISQVDQLRRFGSVEDLRRFFAELGSARVALDDVGAGADNAVARGQMAYKAFVDSGVSAPPQPAIRPQFTPGAVREDLIRRLTAARTQTVSGGGPGQVDVAAQAGSGYAPSFEVTAGSPAAGVSDSVSISTPTPASFEVPDVPPAATSLDLLSGLRRFNPDMLDSSLSPATASSGLMDFTITPAGQATLASSALDDLLGQLRSAAPSSVDVSPGKLWSASTPGDKLPDTFFNQFATSSADVSAPAMPAAGPTKRPWTRSRGIWDQPLADRVRAARDRRMTGLGMPTQSSFDQMMGGLRRDFTSRPAPEENVREAVEAILAGNAERRVSEQGRILESAPTTVLGPEGAVRSSAADRASTAATAAESEDTAKLLRGAESVMPQSAGLTREQLRKMAVEGLGGEVRAPLAFKEVEMRSSQARPGAATLDRMAQADARIEALRESLEADYPDPAAVRSRLAEISSALKSGDAMPSDDRAGLRAERASLRDKLADSEMPGYMEARNSALQEIADAEASARAAQDSFAATSMGSGSVANAQQAILDKLMSRSDTFNEQEFFSAAEDLFGSTSKGGAVDAPRVFNAIRSSARNAGLPEPSDSDIIYAALRDLQDPTRHAMGDRSLRAASDYIARGLNARTSATPYGPDAPLLAIGQHDRPKSVWELINDQFERVAGPMLDTPAPPPPLPAVYDQFIPPFLRLQATRDNVNKAFQGMTLEEAQSALDQLNAAESAARSVTLPPTQDPAVLANIIAEARAAGRRRLGNVPPASRRPLTITQSDSQTADLAALESDVAAARAAVEELTQDPTGPMRSQVEELERFVAGMRQGDSYGGADETAEQFAARSDAATKKLARLRGDLEVSGRYPKGEHPELMAARRELQESEQRLEAARAEAPASDQPMDPAGAGETSSAQRQQLFALAARRASLQRTAVSAAADSQDDVLDRVTREIAGVDAEIDAIYSGQASAALNPPRVVRTPAPTPKLPARVFSSPSPVVVRSAEDLRDAVRTNQGGISYAFVVPKDTAQALRSRVNPDLARMKITRETGNDEVALSGLIGGGEIEGGIRFTNPSDLSRLPTDGSVEVLHLDKDGRPTFYDPAGMDLRNPTALELEDLRAAEARAARDASGAERIQRAAEDEAMRVTAGDTEFGGDEIDSQIRNQAALDSRKRVQERVQAARLARRAQRARNRQPVEKVAPDVQPEQVAGSDDEFYGRAGVNQEANADGTPKHTFEGEPFVYDDEGGKKTVLQRVKSAAKTAGGAMALYGAYELGKGTVGEFFGGTPAVAGEPVFSTGYSDEEDTNSSAERALGRVRRARSYGYLTSQNQLPR